MGCCGQCVGIENLFDDKTAKKDLKYYHKKGPLKGTKMLIDEVSREGVEGMRLLDIGGGVGVIQHELVKKGVAAVDSVDGASSYLAAAQREARRQGLPEIVSYRHGNFVAIAPELEPADIVTLDRVICCFDDMPALVSASSDLANKIYAVVFPIDNWIIINAMRVANLFLKIIRHQYRMFVHPTEKIEEIILGKGLKRKFYQRVGMWQVVVYTR